MQAIEVYPLSIGKRGRANTTWCFNCKAASKILLASCPKDPGDGCWHHSRNVIAHHASGSRSLSRGLIHTQHLISVFMRKSLGKGAASHLIHIV